MSDIYSFYQLISKYQIEIPIIQRDYAQGRNNSKAADVRKSLVDNMIKAAKEDKPLFFDFVYGRVDNNKFIPFDGQQRLTTLFLFHKYVFEKCQSYSGCNHKDNCFCRGILGRFSYATRQSSREFCEKLVQKDVIPSDGKKLSDNIKNLSWFYPDWEKDPTVMGMLTMLDEIHCQMRNETDFKTFAEKLTSGCNCPITFHFVDMGEHKMSDETYVKMNARGKTLTPFENFKASLEQYLEEKSKTDLLNRWKGNYDEPKQIYTGIDGIWLDLFWKVANQGKEGAKELPDTLIMSFFNRHFMNVWRCWYANPKSEKPEKKEEYDTFNTRIQKEMPLYPTKDNFVSFEIYSYVMDNCGVDECLTPIFNIWDKLCEQNQDNINETCQATWNRGDGKEKWNLYVGIINNDNRETYPSRVAFYALLRYFGVQNEKNKTKLSQWMRIVWNIIENSTIDSPDTYQAALRLIDNLSKKCHDIHDALANHFGDFKLGSQYHAQEQVKEEIAKATQILNGKERSDGKTWEEIIIEAERYAFFKGAIRFLFQNAEGKVTEDSWELFGNKWEKAKKYIDKNGEIVEECKTNAILLRALLSRINIGENWFGYNKEFWHTYLLNSEYQSAIHYLLTTTQLEIEQTCTKDWINSDSLLQNVLCHNSWHILNNWQGYSVLTRYSQRRSNATLHKEIIVLNDLRNKLLNSNDIEIPQEHKVAETIYLYGWDIQFKYQGKCFQWHRDGYVRMIGDLVSCEPVVKVVKDGSKDAPEEKWYCFSANDIDTEKLFTDKLNGLIEDYNKSKS